ncbi:MULTISPECIES: restriction endonuclease subunit S [Halorubrum]|uniref:restriction endonuclease subunit S n=1 Tax=Halorubrum TaxID=56688 RepID=UPI0009B5D407|nr:MULTISPECIES: restriction endonuclease subunit S [Halorubrum]TKX68258.1 restriction endonuclease subunit S [Halorubrum sp. GN11GM_10-3_MGM]
MSEQIDLTDYTDSDAEEGSAWVEKRLGDVFDSIYSGGTPKKGVDGYYGGNIPFVKIEDLNEQQGDGVTTAKDFITEQALDETSTRAFDSGTLLMTIYGSLAETAIVHSRVATNQGILGLWDADEDNVLYLRYAIDNTQPKLASLSRQTTQANLGKGIVKKHKIPTPPLSEQRKIATVLYTADQAIEKTKEIIEQTHSVKKALIQDLFHGRHKNFEDNQSTPVGEIPPHWSVASIGDVVHTAQYGISESLSEEGQYPIFRMNNIENGKMVDEPLKYIDLDDDEFEKYRVEKGDILFNRTNSLELVGKTGIYELEGDHVFASYLVRLQTNTKADSHYLNYYMNSSEAQNRMMDFATKGVSQANINANSIQQVKLPLPPIEEQKEIVDRLSSIDSQIETNEQYKSQLKRLKRGLMQDLLSGTVRTTDTNIEVPEKIAQYG